MEGSMQRIKCEVKGCQFYNNEDVCTLKEIKVNNNEVDHANDKTETLCDSYKSKKSQL